MVLYFILIAIGIACIGFLLSCCVFIPQTVKLISECKRIERDNERLIDENEELRNTPHTKEEG